MLVGDARAVARQWVEEESRSLTAFHGAYLAGSISSMPDDAMLPAASDIDIKVVLDLPDVMPDPQKFVYRQAVLDVSYGSMKDVASPEVVLGNYYTAVHFAYPSLLSDPTGDLSYIQAVVATEYPRREWVRRRCEHARETLEASLAGGALAGAIDNAVFGWLLAIIFMPPMVLVADLRNPTHRRGLATFRQIVERYGFPEFHERVLDAVGSTAMTRHEVGNLLDACTEAFDTAVAIRKSPFLMGSNISPFARPISIGGAQELIAEGFHREAMPWIAFIHTLCHTVFQNDASEDVRARFAPGYQHLLMALGVSRHEDLAGRMQMIRQLIPGLWSVAEDIIQANPAIRD